MLSPCFIRESVFYTQSVMLSLRFIPESVFYTQSVVRLSAVHVLYWLRSPQKDWMNFLRIALNMFLSGLYISEIE